jgi:hypothetical protein
MGRAGVGVLEGSGFSCRRVLIQLMPASNAAASVRFEYGSRYCAVGGRNPPPFTLTETASCDREMTKE